MISTYFIYIFSLDCFLVKFIYKIIQMVCIIFSGNPQHWEEELGGVSFHELSAA